MTEEHILTLYRSGSEEAIAATEQEYGDYCLSIARQILRNEEDARECVNDTYLQAWRTLPTQPPQSLRAYLGALTRNNALNLCQRKNAKKRTAEQLALALEELSECVSDSETEDQRIDRWVFREKLNLFLTGLNWESRVIFLSRYWYVCSVAEIAQRYGITENKVRVSLYRTRKKLKAFLEKEGMDL